MTAPEPSRPPPRPTAVTASALVLVIGSLLTAMLAASLFGSTEGIEEQLPGGRFVALAMTATLVLSSVAGITTAVGLFRVRHWARLAMLIIAGSLVAFCSASALVVLAIPVAEIAGTNAARASTVRTLMLIAYAIPGAIGTGWLVYFTREPTKVLFAADGPIAPSGVPLTIALIAWTALLGGVTCLALPFVDAPAFVGGAVLTGWASGTFYAVLALVQLYVGRGLLRLDERARLVGIWFFGLGALYGVAGMVLPGLRAETLAYGRSLVQGLDSPVALDVTAVWWWISAIVIAGFAIPCWLLVRWRPRD